MKPKNDPCPRCPVHKTCIADMYHPCEARKMLAEQEIKIERLQETADAHQKLLEM